MKVKELIEELQLLNAEAVVKIKKGDTGLELWDCSELDWYEINPVYADEGNRPDECVTVILG